MNKNLQIFRSSAGSGKTYTLALGFIALALVGERNGYKDYYRKILAITFTNKAAAEMKARVLDYLYCLSNENDKDNIILWLRKETKLSESEIFTRASDIHNHILHHYADLGIFTIDKFTYKLVRTFATDLELSQNFDLEMDNHKIIQPVIALLLERIDSSGGELSSTLLDFAYKKIEDGGSSNIEKDLENFALQLFSEEVSTFLDCKYLRIEQCVKIKKRLQTSKNDIALKIKGLAKETCAFFDSNGLTSEHFLRGTFFNHFKNNLDYSNDIKWLPSNSLIRNVANDIWYADGKSKEIKDLVETLKSQLKVFFFLLMDLINEYNSVNAVLKNMHSISIINELLSEIKLYKKENNIEQISAFNYKINKVITSQPSSFIYERLGERYSHYLIDEFQDTSLLQWQNILPLITDSIDYGKSIIVGDGKQSIYRWRGGEIEQFLKLPKIYKGEKLIFKNEWENKLKTHYKSNNLLNNFRSRKLIVEFNNQFFKNTKELLSDDYIGIYNEQEQDAKFAKEGGYIHIELFGDKQNDFRSLIIDKMVFEINKLVTENNYDYSDIAILCNSKKSVVLVAESLSAANIPVVSNEGLLIQKSDKVNLIVSLLQYLQNPNEDIPKLVIVDYIYRNFLQKENIHSLNLSISSENEFRFVLNKAGIYLDTKNILQEPLFEIVEHLIRLFKLDDDIYLSFFLDVILFYVEKQGGSLSRFLIWWEERKSKEAIVIPEGTNAVQVMTIHKSKGLAFNVVMIPFNWEDRRNIKEIWVDTSAYFEQDLPQAFVGVNKKLEYSFFKDEYNKDNEMVLLDNLNKLYVAMTRSKDRLYIYSKYLPEKIPPGFANKGYLNSFLHKYSIISPLILGDANMMRENKDIYQNNFSITSKNKLDWREVISLKHSAQETWCNDDISAKLEWGKLLHLVLSEIHYSEQKDMILDKFLFLGKCSHSEYKELKIAITNLLNNEEVEPYFTKQWLVKTEAEILTEDGKTYIPDRLLFSKDTDDVVIIDYKTGIRQVIHTQQISEYAIALKRMGKSKIKKILIYTEDPLKVELV